MRKRAMYEEFLKKVALLSSMDAYQRTIVADAFVEKKWNRGDTVIQEGEHGSEFYFVVQGKAQAVKKINGRDVEVMTYKAGDYFGERALIKHEPRDASILALSQLTTV